MTDMYDSGENIRLITDIHVRDRHTEKRKVQTDRSVTSDFLGETPKKVASNMRMTDISVNW